MNDQQELDDLASRLRAAGVRGMPLDILERGDPKEIAAMQDVVAPLLGRYHSHDAFAQTHLGVFARRWPRESAVEDGFRALQAGKLSDLHASHIAASLAKYTLLEKHFLVVRRLLVVADSGDDLRFQLLILLSQFAGTRHADEAADLVVAEIRRKPYSFLDVGSRTLLQLRAFNRRSEVCEILETSVVHPEVRRTVERRLASMERAAAKAAKARPKARPEEPTRRGAQTSSSATSRARESKDNTPKAGPTKPARGKQAAHKTKPSAKKATPKKATPKKATAKKPATARKTSSKPKPRAKGRT